MKHFREVRGNINNIESPVMSIVYNVVLNTLEGGAPTRTCRRSKGLITCIDGSSHEPLKTVSVLRFGFVASAHKTVPITPLVFHI